MKYWLVVVQWMVLATAMAAPYKPPKANPNGHRFLFILETSAAMNRLEHGGRQAIFDLLHSGIDGRMRDGDTYGIWTFNELPYAGVYPMQVWDAPRNLEHASSAGRFLKMQKYEKDGNLTNLLKQVQSVLRVAKDLNLFIVTDGNTMLSGTPFDADINAQYRATALQVRETKRPVITTLTARAGNLTAASVTLAGEKILLAELPPETNAVAKAEVSAPPGPATITNPPPALAIVPRKPLGEIIAMSDADAQAAAARRSNALAQATATGKVTPVFAELTPAAASATNAVEQPVVVDSPPIPARPLAAPAVTAEVAAKAAPHVAPTNEIPAPAPTPLPAMVPAQIKVSARAAGDRPVLGPSIFSPNLMLILGWVFVGASLVGGLIFLRRVREPKQPSFISQGMDRQ